MNIEETLTKKAGPLPIGVWAVLIGGGLGIVYLLSKRQSSTEIPILDVTSPDSSLAAVTRISPGYIPTPVPVYDTSGPITTGAEASKGVTIDPADLGYKPTTPGKKTSTPQPIPPRVPTPPTKTPQPSAPKYPGLADGYVLNCANAYTGLHGEYSTVYAEQRRQKGNNDTFLRRNMMAIAIQGNTGPWINTGDWNNPISINNRRVRNGLHPLTNDEINRLLGSIGNWSAEARGDEKKVLAHSEELFNTWNRPYQCSASNTIRKTR